MYIYMYLYIYTYIYNIYIYIHIYLHPKKRDRIGGIIQPAPRSPGGPLGIIWSNLWPTATEVSTIQGGAP